VRNLEREIGAVCRKIATRITENGKIVAREIDSPMCASCSGRLRFQGNEEVALRTSLPGVATGLAWTPIGGDVLFIEATRMPGSKGFLITGSLGNVMQESARAALSTPARAPSSWASTRTSSRKPIFTCTFPPGRSPKTALPPASP
jgi:ATP-dependent Lon protease